MAELTDSVRVTDQKTDRISEGSQFTWCDEVGAVSDDFVILQSDIGDAIGNLDTVLE